MKCPVCGKPLDEHTWHRRIINEWRGVFFQCDAEVLDQYRVETRAIGSSPGDAAQEGGE